MCTGSGELEFEEFCMLASKFLVEDEEDVNTELLTSELKEAFRFYDREGRDKWGKCFKCVLFLDVKVKETKYFLDNENFGS